MEVSNVSAKKYKLNVSVKWAAFAFVCWFITGCHAPEAPEYYGFQDIQIAKVSGQQTNLSATLKFFNPNHFSLQLKRAEVDVSLNGKPAGHSVLDSTIFIPQRDTFYVPVTMQVNLQSLFSNALQLLTERQVTIALDGRVKLKKGMFPINRPFHYEGKQDLSSLLSGSGF
jgi:LEA14-like dessication related protein